jgi:cytochrome c oxidase subunit 1
MAVASIGGVVAIVGGGMYILVTVATILFGKKVEQTGYSSETTVLEAAPAMTATEEGFTAKGTLVFAFVFLGLFVVYYAVNWKYLASVWPMS